MNLTHTLAALPARLAAWAGYAALGLCALLLAACGGGSDEPAAHYSANASVAQKGPLIQGSTVTAQELDAALSPTGLQYGYATTTNLGGYTPTAAFASPFVGVSASGYYVDEVTGAVSTGPVTLSAYGDLGASPALNINVLTTLAHRRIQQLVGAEGLAFADAEAQAGREVLAALHIPGAHGAFRSLSLAGTTDGDRMLAAMSALFVQGRNAAELSALIAEVQSDIGTHGAIVSANATAALAASARALNPATVAANLMAAYGASGLTITAADIGRWIDADGDGVVAGAEFSVADASASSIFTLPPAVTSPLVGGAINASGGQLLVNGAAVSGAVLLHAGDVVALAPGVSPFPNGAVAAYLSAGGARVARVRFVNSLQSLLIAPAAASVARGLAQRFSATGTFSDGGSADLTSSVHWASGTPAVADIDAASGLAQTLQLGSATITASLGSVAASASLTVTAAQLASIVISPNPALAGVGTTTQMQARGLYTDGTTADLGGLVTWAASAPAVATVGSGTGLVTGLALGTTTLSATMAGLSQSAVLTISASGSGAAASLLTDRDSHSATLLADGRVLVAGGYGASSGARLNSVEIYDPVRDVWTATTGMISARVGHKALLLPGGKVLVLGGVSSGPLSGPMVEIYDPATGSWSRTAQPSLGDRLLGATLLGSNEVLATGGSDFDPVHTSAAIYQPESDTWVAVPGIPDDGDPTNFPTNRHGVNYESIRLANGKVMVAGGVYDYDYASAAVTLFDPATRLWTPAAGMGIALQGFTTTLLAGGQVLLTCGSDADSPTTYSDGALRYDPALNAWSLAGALGTPRRGHTASLMRDGSVLVVGGADPRWDGVGYVTTVQRLPPNGTVWLNAGSLSAGRSGHTATLLGNGKLLLVGGGSALSASVELRW